MLFPSAITVSPDQGLGYVAADGGCNDVHAQPITRKLTWHSCTLDQTQASRNPYGCYTSGIYGLQGGTPVLTAFGWLSGVTAISVSPDSSTVYVSSAGGSSLVFLKRDPSRGDLFWSE